MVDIGGALNGGRVGVLIDRDGSRSEMDCPRVKSLSEVYLHIR